MVDKGHFEDLLNQLEHDVLSLDRTGDTSFVHMVFRSVHNLKSSAAELGLASLSREIHELEDALDRIRRGRDAWSAATFDRVTRVIDLVRLTVLGDRPSPPRDAPAAPAADPKRWGLALTAEEEASCQQALAGGQGLFRVDKLFRRGLSRETFDALPILEDIRELGTLLALQPSWQAYSQGADEQVVKFLFASPRSEAELAEVLFDPLITLNPPGSLPASVRTEGLRFLIVEDDPTAGGLLQYILMQHGECRLCETGGEGLAAFRESWERGAPIDMMILDLFLPDIHGDSILHEIREFEFKRGVTSVETRCLVLINTASTDLDQLRQSLRLEPDGYLIKPINVSAILDKVANLKAARIG